MTTHTQDEPITAATIFTYLAIMVLAAVTLGWVVIPVARRPAVSAPVVKTDWRRSVLFVLVACFAGCVAAAIGVAIVYALPA